MIIENGIETAAPAENSVRGGNITFNNSRVEFKGTGNILYAAGDITLTDSVISFNGDDAVLYLSACEKRDYKLKLDLWRETASYFGGDNYYNGVLSCVISERKNLFVGRKGVFSFGIWVRTADPHLIYDIDEMTRINPSKSVMIGDHVWLGQNSLILKGSRIGSGSVIGGNAVVAGKRVESNSIYAGNPARLVRDRIFFRGASVHNYTEEKTEKSMTAEKTNFIYGEKGNSLDLDRIDDMLTHAADGEERLGILERMVASSKRKDRFYVPGRQETSSR